MSNNHIRAEGFEHWILGSADMAEPLTMPTHLPYTFTSPDEQGRVPFPDVVLASGYKWASDPQRGFPFHVFNGDIPLLAGKEAVARCMLRPYMHAVYGAEPFIEEAPGPDPRKGIVNTERWRNSIARFLCRESGIGVVWNGDPPLVSVERDESSENPTPGPWGLVGVDLRHDGRADPIDIWEQLPSAMLRVFSVVKGAVWRHRLLITDEPYTATAERSH